MVKKFYQIVKKLFYIFAINPAFFFKRIFLELRFFFLPTPKCPVLKKINGVSFKFDFNFSPKLKKMYAGNYQPIIADILRKYLRNGDTFIDVGANIGYFSWIAAGLVGKEGEVHSFEPVPEYFQRLNNFAKINSQYNIVANQFAIGDEEKSGKIYIKGYPDIGNNTFFPVLLEAAKENKNKTAEVSIRRLDEYIKEKKLNNIKLIKIDVEGFEFPVLKGLGGYFSECSRTRLCPPIICEIVPAIYSHLGYELEDLFNYMSKFSYYPFEILNTKKRIDVNKIKKIVDVLFKFCK
jgi:FkbM family methyltransferase